MHTGARARLPTFFRPGPLHWQFQTHRQFLPPSKSQKSVMPSKTAAWRSLSPRYPPSSVPPSRYPVEFGHVVASAVLELVSALYVAAPLAVAVDALVLGLLGIALIVAEPARTVALIFAITAAEAQVVVTVDVTS